MFNNRFIPAAKLINDGCYSIITDHLGTPCEAYDADGKKVWEMELDIYGRVQKKDLINDPSVNFSINIDGWWGDTVQETLENMMKSCDITGWEVEQLLKEGRLGEADIYWKKEKVDNPFSCPG